MLFAIGIVAALVASGLLVPKVRQWVLAKTMPTLRQTWPRLIEVLGQPWRLALAVGGNLLMTLGFIFAFDASLAAFGQDASLIQVALVYLAGNTAGALVPTPGGMGTIELALATRAHQHHRHQPRCRHVDRGAVPRGHLLAAHPDRLGGHAVPAEDRRALDTPPGRHLCGTGPEASTLGQASALAFSWLNSFWSIVPASSSAFASAMCSAGDFPAATSRM